MGFSDTFAVIGVLLAVAAVALLFARKVGTERGAGGPIETKASVPAKPTGNQP